MKVENYANFPEKFVGNFPEKKKFFGKIPGSQLVML